MQGFKSSFRNKAASRKFFLMVSILFLGFAAMCLPSLTLFFPYVKLASIMTGGEFVSLVIGAFAVYCGANVFQKKMELDKGINEDGVSE